MVFEERDSRLSFLGTCFAFRHKNHFLTAAHCVSERDSSALAIAHPVDGTFAHASEIHLHPRADIALIRLASEGREKTEPFWDFVGNYSLGEDFMAYGFPEDSPAPHRRIPTARLLRGHYQRFMEHKSHMGYAYVAGELNIPCPGGLSGGPLFRPGAFQMITGLVTENLEAATLLESEEHTLVNGTKVHDHYRRVINYGVAVMLDQVSEWINATVPPRKM